MSTPPPPPGKLQVSDAVRFGWDGFRANFTSVIIIVLVVVGIQLLLGLVNSAVAGSRFLSFAMTVFSVFVGFVLTLGLIRAALAIVDGRSPTTDELLSADGVTDYIIAALLLSLGYGLVAALGLISFLLAPVSALIIIVGSFLVQFFGYAIVDERAASLDGITRSIEVVRANVGPVIVLWLAAIGLVFVGILLCFVGLLVTLPVIAIAYSYAWRTMTGGIVRDPGPTS